ncbi:MAG: hypothetical protein Q7S47_00670 [bacterium]|nr:hypothetical protein [bacterium]
MLEQIFGSKTRSRLLKIFLMNPDKAFFIRELTRMIDTQINSVRRELDNLSQCGIIKAITPNDGVPIVGIELDEDEQKNDSKVVKGKKKIAKVIKKHFMVNTSFVLYRELSNLLMRSPLLFQEKFISDIKALEGVDFALMTGFFVDHSDASVDLLIVGSTPKARLTKIISSYEKEFEREINYSSMTTEEFLYRKSLTDRFLCRILDAKKIVIVDTISTR